MIDKYIYTFHYSDGTSEMVIDPPMTEQQAWDYVEKQKKIGKHVVWIDEVKMERRGKGYWKGE